MKQIIKQLIEQKNLTQQQACYAMDLALDNGATPAQISAFLCLLRAKGETVDEIIGCASVLKQKASHILPKTRNYIDLVGTGGDGANTFNISTTAAIVVAAAGVPVAKHGNRAISSRSGSIDLLENLGIRVDLSPQQVEKCIDTLGIGFMFAKVFHQSMKTISSVRQDLGIRTIMNILGPISNPSNAKTQIIGVFSESLTEPIAKAMMELGVENGLVMCSDGIDEFVPCSKARISQIVNGTVQTKIFNPQDFGIEQCELSEIAGGDAKQNAIITREILSGEKGAKRDTVVLNAAMTLYTYGSAKTVKIGIEQAKKAIDSKRAIILLENLAKLTNSI